ncbi:hypothetical protein BB559_001786 [Furculomyces boomerangus]|uniref:EamA domain-containing protein n=2 Tax=Harpellales TaxID=61421 RepID=A0A2T9Z0E7_9FUNG|nr:hypothetical protein BB559_001786 [Furculomyces boomerangus]PWA02909.1 hypothetical protein BB558_000947 [Smittium angustum]
MDQNTAESVLGVKNDGISEQPQDSHQDSFKNKSTKEKVIYMIKAIVIGQVLSLCIAGTSTMTNSLTTNLGISIPTTQSFFLYVLLMVVYVPYTYFKYGLVSLKYFKKIWYWYILLGFVDVEGNYFVVKAYNYTSLLSCALLDVWTLPCVVLLTFVLFRVKYKLGQYTAIAFCLAGLGTLIYLDNKDDGNVAGPNPVKGDIFMIIGATFYALSNILLEYIVRQRPVYETLGYLGVFGTIINGIQLVSLELNEIRSVSWTAQAVGYNAGFVIFMFLFYSLTPYLFRITSATFFNLSILTSDVYILVISIFVFENKVSALYSIAFVLVVFGLLIFNISPTLAGKNIVKLPGFRRLENEV